MTSSKLYQRLRRHAHIRRKVSGSSQIPRLVVFRSNKYIYAQVIDDTHSVTLAAVLTVKGKDLAFTAGEKLAKLVLAKKITKVVFDRAGYKYHGRIKALAEGARKAGLVF